MPAPQPNAALVRSCGTAQDMGLSRTHRGRMESAAAPVAETASWAQVLFGGRRLRSPAQPGRSASDVARPLGTEAAAEAVGWAQVLFGGRQLRSLAQPEHQRQRGRRQLLHSAGPGLHARGCAPWMPPRTSPKLPGWALSDAAPWHASGQGWTQRRGQHGSAAPAAGS